MLIGLGIDDDGVFRFEVALPMNPPTAFTPRTNGILVTDGFMLEIEAADRCAHGAVGDDDEQDGRWNFTTSGLIARDRLSNAVRKR